MGKKTDAAITKFAAENGTTFTGEMTPSLWITLASKAREKFPLPYLSLQAPLSSNRSGNLLISSENEYKVENCQWLVNFFQDTSWGRGHPASTSDYQEYFKPIVLPDVSLGPQSFVDDSNVFHDSLLATTQSCYADGNENSCKTLIEVIQWMKDESAFVFNNPIDDVGGDTYYFTTKRVLNPALIGYSAAVQKIGKPTDHAEIGNWFYAALTQNSFDPFLPESLQQKDMLFFSAPEDSTGACEKHGLSFNHSLYQAMGLSFYGVMWDDANAASQAYDRLLYSVDSGALSDDGVMLCEASRGSNAMFYSGASLLNVLYTIKLARNQGVEIESPAFISKVEKAADFLYESAFDLSKIEPYAAENHLAWCDEDYKKQCIHNGAGRIASFSWMRHFAELYPNSPVTAKIMKLKDAPVGNDDEKLRVSGAIVKSNFMISEVNWTIPTEQEDSHETHTRSNNGPQFLNIMDANLISNVCAVSER